MISPTDITKEVVLADIKANGPSLVKDITGRLLDLSPKAAKNLARTHTRHHDKVYMVLRALVALGVVATELSGAQRAKNQRRGKYYITKTEPPGRTPSDSPSMVVSGAGVFATRHDGVVFRYAPVSGDPNGEWHWQRLPDLPQD